MKLKKAIKLKVRLESASGNQADRQIDKHLLQSCFTQPRETYKELEISVSSVKVPSPHETQITFVIQGEQEAADDFAAYASDALHHLLATDAAQEILGHLKVSHLSETK